MCPNWGLNPHWDDSNPLSHLARAWQLQMLQRRSRIWWKWSMLWKAYNKQNTWECWTCMGCDQQRSVTGSARTRSRSGDSKDLCLRFWCRILAWNMLWQNLLHSFCYQSRRNIMLQLLMTWFKPLPMTQVSSRRSWLEMKAGSTAVIQKGGPSRPNGSCLILCAWRRHSKVATRSRPCFEQWKRCWESCVRSQAACFEGDWGVIVLYVQCFLYLASSINVSICHSTWLDTLQTDLVVFYFR